MGQTTGDSLAGLLRAAPDAMVCVNAGGRIVAANELAERMFGYAGGELAGLPVEALIPDPARLAHVRHRAAYLAAPQPRLMARGMTSRGRRRDGCTFPVEIAVSAVDMQEGTVVVAAVRDTSERPGETPGGRREPVPRPDSPGSPGSPDQQHYQAQRLESLAQLASRVGHDFNNFLGAISGYASFIREEVAGEPSPAQWQAVREDIGEVERAAQRAAVLTGQLLAFSKEQIATPRLLDINEVVRDLNGLLVHTLGEPVELVTSLGEGLGPVHADPRQLQQVLLNVAVNARDAMPWGGKLTIQTTSVQVSEAQAGDREGLTPGEFVCLKVIDTGKGIPAEILDRVFEPFFTTKPERQGTGLGLATVYGLIKQAAGHTWISSEPGSGTTVTVLLPVAASATGPAQAPPRQEPEGGNGEIVLIVEDDAVMREVVRRMLDRNGYRVLTAADGEQAVEIAAQRGRIDLLLTDVVLPRRQGAEVASQVRALIPGVRVLFMSGYSGGVLGAQGSLDPRFELIEKPFSAPVLLHRLREILTAPA